jgi:hypothetical protein
MRNIKKTLQNVTKGSVVIAFASMILWGLYKIFNERMKSPGYYKSGERTEDSNATYDAPTRVNRYEYPWYDNYPR